MKKISAILTIIIYTESVSLCFLEDATKGILKEAVIGSTTLVRWWDLPEIL